MPKSPPKPPKMAWAVVATWKRYSLHRVKDDAEQTLKAWAEARKSAGMAVSGSLGAGYRAVSDPAEAANDKKRASEGLEPVATQTARVIKLADHPVCYIGVLQDDVDRLRELESEENPAYESYSALAKQKSADWRQVEAL